MASPSFAPAGTPARRLDRARAALLLVDLQENLLPAIWERTRVVRESLRLAKGFSLLGLPVLVTEQYRRGLGPTLTEVASAVPNFDPVQKMAFSGCTPEILDRLRNRDLRDVVLCGIESHVCVTQTALDLLDAGFRVFAATDACSSRTPENWRSGLDRMQSAGSVLVSVEMALFELLGRAGTDEFKRMLDLVKQGVPSAKTVS
jgi:nicotinamidase-related amidase